jgi:hypothetical protein
VNTLLAKGQNFSGEKNVTGEYCVNRWRLVNSLLVKSQYFTSKKNIADKGSFYHW